MEQLKIFCEKNLFNSDFILDPDGTFTEPGYAFLLSLNEVYIHNGIGDLKESGASFLDVALIFLGMPFFTDDLTWKTFCKNFFGWDEQKYLLPINIIRACFFGLFNLLFIIPRFILNIVKLATELVPLFLRVMVHGWTNKLISLLSSSSGYHWFTKIFIALPLVILFPLYIVFKLAHIIGRAITSPHKNLYVAWQAGQELAGDGILGKIAGGFFCLIGLALTTLAYLILFPIAIKLIMTYAPTVITSAVQTVLNFLAPLSSFGTALGTVTTPIFQLFGGFFYYIGSPVINGLAGVIGLTVGPFVVLLDKIDEGLAKFSEWWRTPSPWFKDQGKNVEIPDNPVDLRKMGKKVQTEVSKVIQDPKPTVIPTTRPQASTGQNFHPQSFSASQQVPTPTAFNAGQQRPPSQQIPLQEPKSQALTATSNAQQAVVSKLSQPQKQKAGGAVLRQYKPLPDQRREEPIEINRNALTIVFDDFHVLGKGASGCVYKAVYKGLDVAVKQVKKGQSKFDREYTLMKWANKSPYIVYSYGVCTPERMIVMEFIHKGSLDKFLRQAPAPPWEIRYSIGLDVTMAMIHLHAGHIGGGFIIHGDLKSLNVLIDKSGRAKLTDFDMAKYKENAFTSTLLGPTDGRGGTFSWMAPELFKAGQKTTKKSDAYSYGMVLWELGSKKFPYENIPLSQLADHVGQGHQETITKDTPPFMGSVISQCWLQDPQHRPDLDDDLAKCLIEEFNSYDFKF